MPFGFHAITLEGAHTDFCGSKKVLIYTANKFLLLNFYHK